METLLKDFLMQTRAVEARRKGKFDVLLQIRIRRGSPDSFRIESLIQHEPQEDGLVVQAAAAVFEVDLPQSSI